MGRAPCCSKVGLMRGAWTAREDAVLKKYVENNGEGQWRYVPKKAGLLRCGKTCRLRWLNYIRPTIKRGNIGQDEEELIINLHALLGNRWALIAKRLPGRTDNEIKNYWNTHITKTLKITTGSSRPPKDYPSVINGGSTKVYHPKPSIAVGPLPLATNLRAGRQKHSPKIQLKDRKSTIDVKMTIMACVNNAPPSGREEETQEKLSPKSTTFSWKQWEADTDFLTENDDSQMEIQSIDASFNVEEAKNSSSTENLPLSWTGCTDDWFFHKDVLFQKMYEEFLNLANQDRGGDDHGKTLRPNNGYSHEEVEELCDLFLSNEFDFLI